MDRTGFRSSDFHSRWLAVDRLASACKQPPPHDIAIRVDSPLPRVRVLPLGKRRQQIDRDVDGLPRYGADGEVGEPGEGSVEGGVGECGAEDAV